MDEKSKKKVIIGRTAMVAIPSEGIDSVAAKIDTGADSSSIWASELHVDQDNVLSFCLFAYGSPYYTGKRHATRAYTASIVRSAHGTVQIRYRVQMTVRLGNRLVRGTFTLAERSNNTYPILIGCRLLRNKFLVDVAKDTRPIRRTKRAAGIKSEFQQNPQAFFEKYHSNNHRGDIEL